MFISAIEFVILGLTLYVAYRLLQIFVLKYVIVCEKTSQRILKDYNIHSKSALYSIYVLYFLSTILFAYFVYLVINGERWAYVVFIGYPLFIIFTGTLLYELRKALLQKRKIQQLHRSEFAKKHMYKIEYSYCSVQHG